MSNPTCVKCNKDMSLVAKWWQCSGCDSFYCPSCKDGFCMLCKKAVKEAMKAV